MASLLITGPTMHSSHHRIGLSPRHPLFWSLPRTPPWCYRPFSRLMVRNMYLLYLDDVSDLVKDLDVTTSSASEGYHLGRNVQGGYRKFRWCPYDVARVRCRSQPLQRQCVDGLDGDNHGPVFCTKAQITRNYVLARIIRGQFSGHSLPLSDTTRRCPPRSATITVQ